VREHRELVQVFGEPRGGERQMFSIVAVWACSRITLSACGR